MKRPALRYQRPDAPIRQVAIGNRRAIARELKAALGQLPKLMDRKRAVYLALHGRWREVSSTIDWKHFREVLKGVFDRIAITYESGAAYGAQRINSAHRRGGKVVRFGKAIGDRFNFDRFDTGTVAALRAEQDRLIRKLEADAHATIEQAVLSGAMQGLGPEAVVDRIRDVIGLTDRQAQAVLNYRRLLEDLDPQALVRRLRDDEMDDVVRRAMEGDISLDDATLDQLVGRYEENYLDYRADTIAQTESTRAANSGLHDAYRQAVERGALPGEAVRRYWQVALDEKTCPVCLSIPEMNPNGVAVGESFRSIVGPFEDPPDPHPNCRCSVEYVTDIDLVPDVGDN